MDLYEKVIELYNNGKTINDIQRILNISYGKYYRMFKWAKAEGRLIPRGKGNSKGLRESRVTTHIGRNNPYYDYYNINNKGEYFCCVKGYGNAVKVVERLKECDWDKSKVQAIKRSVLIGE